VLDHPTVGAADSEVPTPSLVLDEDRLNGNIIRMAAFAASRGLGLRPHVKTHKSIEIARRQRAAGARGITVATIGEAQVFAEAGFDDIFVAYPLWLDHDKTRRLLQVVDQTNLIVGVDSAEGAARLAEAMAGRRHRVRVLVEVDSGHHRSGGPGHGAGGIAAAAASAGLDVAGVFTFPGHSYAPEHRAGAAAEESLALAEAVEALARQGIVARIVSGGSTPSAAHADPTVLTEMRPGSYVFNDAQQWELGSCTVTDLALTVTATVVSRRSDHVIADAGSKVLSSDRGAYSTGFGRLPAAPAARVTTLSEHHATITGVAYDPGTRISIAPNHCCVAVNLADAYVVTRAGQVVDRWPVDARGHNR